MTSSFLNEKKALGEFLKKNGLRTTKQRVALLDLFLKNRGHLSPGEIYAEVRRKYPHYGWATVYRTLKIFSQARLVNPVKFDEHTSRYEPETAGRHHDHLVCLVCGSTIEFYDDKIERQQAIAAKARGFAPESHSLEIHGVCSKCRKRPR